MCATCPSLLILLDFITRIILGEQYRSQLVSIIEYLPYLTFLGNDCLVKVCGPLLY
jgi:hypothetical protein